MRALRGRVHSGAIGAMAGNTEMAGSLEGTVVNMKSAARNTARILGCPHAECPKQILCSETYVASRRRTDPQPVPQPRRPQQPGTGAVARPELNTEDLIDA
jgi:hypothetical protein